MDRFAQMIIAAARPGRARTRGIDIAAGSLERIGASISDRHRRPPEPSRTANDYAEDWRGPDRVNPLSIPSIIPNMGGGVGVPTGQPGTQGPLKLGEVHRVRGHQQAIGDAMDEIRPGRADVMLAGGTEA